MSTLGIGDGYDPRFTAGDPANATGSEHIYDYLTATAQVNVDNSLLTSRRALPERTCGERWGILSERSQLNVVIGDMLFRRSPTSDVTRTGNSWSAFSSFDNVPKSPHLYTDYLFAGFSATKYSFDCGPPYEPGVTAVVRGTANFQNAADKPIYAGQLLLWELRPSSGEYQTEQNYGTRHASSKRPRLSAECATKANLAPVSSGGMSRHLRDLARLNFTDAKAKEQRLSALIPSSTIMEQWASSVSADPRYDEKLATVDLSLSAIVTMGMLVGHKLGYCTINAAKAPPAGAQPMQDLAARVSHWTGLDGREAPMKTDLISEVMRHLYWEEAKMTDSALVTSDPAEWFGPGVAQQLVRAYPSLVAGGYIDNLTRYSARVVGQAGKSCSSGESGLVVM